MPHTPGPWACHSYTGGNGKRFFIETADKRHGLASVAPNETASTMLTMEQHEANAALMAAAPDLFAALESLVSTFDPDAQASYEFARPKINAARAAILAAKGGK